MIGVADILQQLSEIGSTGKPPYPKGFFQSQRYHPFLPYEREDDNLFFSATIAFTLQSHLDLMTDEERELAESIIHSVLGSVHLFRNKDGKPTYNFWQTKPSRHFPNGVLMRHFEHFRIPDDADDTALAHLLLDSDKNSINELKALFELHANAKRKTIKNTWPKFKGLKAISTFFGEKIRIEFDAVVMCNTLLLLFDHFNNDERLIKDSIEYIDGVIRDDLHIAKPFQTAPNYPTTELIIYHVARLLHRHPSCPLTAHTEKLAGQINTLLKHELTPLSSILCLNALLLLNQNNEKLIECDLTNGYVDELANDTKGYFFHAGMLSAFENSISQQLATNPLFHLRYRCSALNLVLLIENRLLKRKPANKH